MRFLRLPSFPNSGNDPFTVTSPQTWNYNCIAWACEDDSAWYWPDENDEAFWPAAIPREESIQAFILLFNSLGYEVCHDDSYEDTYVKVAIFCDMNGKPTHAARQLDNGLWTSKLGREFDVRHSLNSMRSGEYGDPQIFLKRKI